VLLVADIDRGGVFASIVGTVELLEQAERAMLAGIVINRFRGDASLLAPGIAAIEQRCGVPVLGVVPWLKLNLPEEDSVALARKGSAGNGAPLRIGVVKLPHISNYTDFDPLEGEGDVELLYLDTPDGMAGLDLVILPGTKSTIPDLRDLRRRGFARALHDFHAAGGEIVGICGGYQMLGRTIADPHQVESEVEETEGLGLLDVTTVLTEVKQTHQADGTPLEAATAVGFAADLAFSGYEIHMGETTLGPLARALLSLMRRGGHRSAIADGAVSPDGRIWGSYLHGFFDVAPVRRALLDKLRLRRGLGAGRVRPQASLDAELDRLADHLAAHLDLERLFTLLVAPQEGG
jgi:adenosylcobyric acid synthase